MHPRQNPGYAYAMNDLERRNSPYFAVFSPNSIALLANYVTVVEDGPIILHFTKKTKLLWNPWKYLAMV